MRKSAAPGCAARWTPDRGKRRHRSTRRRQDAPPLPRRKVDPRTVGKTYTTPDGKTFRPSLFLTLTCPSYGRVTATAHRSTRTATTTPRPRGTRCTSPRCSTGSSRTCAAYCGYDLQYFAAIEPQRRLAPHVHMAIRGTVSRRELREVIAATYHQVWWPSTATVRFDGDQLPVWDEANADLPGPGNRRGAAHLGPGARRHQRPGRAAARRKVRDQVRRPGRAGRIEGRQPVHRLPDQVPDQAARRLPRARHRRPGRRTPGGSPRRCAGNPAHRPARTGCATASSPRTPGRACGPARARARRTAANTSATPAAAC